MSVLRKMQIGPCLPPCTKLKSNGSKTSKKTPDTVNLTEEEVGNMLTHIGTEDSFLKGTLIGQELISTITIQDRMQLKT